jgi:type I restriction enzyme, S subunit
MGDIERLVLLLPEKPEQQAIADALSDIDDEVAAVEAKVAKWRQIKHGMMQELLTGRIRLVKPEAAVDDGLIEPLSLVQST